MSRFQASRRIDRTSSRMKAETRDSTCAEVREEIEAERQVVEVRTAKLRQQRQARESAGS